MLVFHFYLVSLCVYAAVNDFLYYKIPNKIVLAVLAGYMVRIAYGLYMGTPIDYFLMPGLTFLIVLFISFIFFSIRVFGAGDAKLLAACSLWMSEVNAIQFILLTLIAGGILSIAYIKYNRGLDFYRNLLLAKIIEKFEDASVPEFKEKAVPYAVAILVGVVWVLMING